CTRRLTGLTPRYGRSHDTTRKAVSMASARRSPRAAPELLVHWLSAIAHRSFHGQGATISSHFCGYGLHESTQGPSSLRHSRNAASSSSSGNSSRQSKKVVKSSSMGLELAFSSNVNE